MVCIIESVTCKIQKGKNKAKQVLQNRPIFRGKSSKIPTFRPLLACFYPAYLPLLLVSPGARLSCVRNTRPGGLKWRLRRVPQRWRSFTAFPGTIRLFCDTRAIKIASPSHRVRVYHYAVWSIIFRWILSKQVAMRDENVPVEFPQRMAASRLIATNPGRSKIPGVSSKKWAGPTAESSPFRTSSEVSRTARPLRNMPDTRSSQAPLREATGR
jgi:hypothetical protein